LSSAPLIGARIFRRPVIPPEWLAEFSALLQVIVIDVTLAGDNAIVVGLAAAALPREQRKRAIIVGIAVATVVRVLFAVIAAELLAVIGLTLAGGLLLLWVAWKMFRDSVATAQPVHGASGVACRHPVRTQHQAMVQIIIADVSMSLDNVLAVAGTARQHVWVLVLGLALSVALMGAASTVIARLLHRFPWFAWVGLAIVTWVAVSMIYQGGGEVLHHIRLQ
jgi:YjbE family integral membrane protein